MTAPDVFHIDRCPTGPHAPRYRHSAFDRADAEVRSLSSKPRTLP